MANTNFNLDIQNEAEIFLHLKEHASNDPDFKWLQPVVNRTLDEEVLAFLRENRPQKRAFDPLRVEDNLAESGRLIDTCIAQRIQIQELESHAILSALDIFFMAQKQSIELQLAKVQLEAYRKQASPDPADADVSTLEKRDNLITSARNTRLRLSNHPGSALNYGERVAFLRRIYADNLKLVYERIYALRIGLAASFGIVSKSPEDWNVGGNLLEKLVDWLRNTISAIEYGDASERTFEKLFLLGAGSIFPGSIVNALQNTAADCLLEFSLKREHFSELEVHDEARILAVGVAPTFGEPQDHWRNYAKELIDSKGDTQRPEIYSFISEYLRSARARVTFPITIEPPTQRVEMDDLLPAEREWPLEDIHIKDSSAWTEGPARDGVNVVSRPEFVNAQPFGKWKVTISKDVLYTDRILQLGTLGIPTKNPKVIPEEGAAYLFQLADVALYIRLAVRHRN